MSEPKSSRRKPNDEGDRGGGGRPCDGNEKSHSDSTAEKISQSAEGVTFDWTCPKCGAVRAWKRPWSPEAGPTLHWCCSWCPKTDDQWIWVPKAGWNRILTKQQRQRQGVPYLDHDLRWLLECECGSSHRPDDREIIRHEDGKMEVRDIEPTRFEINCGCGRKRLLLLRNGHWHHEMFEFHPPQPKPPAEPQPPPEDEEPLLPVRIECGKCHEQFEVEARSTIRHVCERCGRQIHLAKHRVYHCEECGDDFEWFQRDEPCCIPCDGLSEVKDTGKVVWKEPPSLSGSTNIAGDIRDQLYGRDEKEGLLQLYEKAGRSGKANIAEEVCEMADELLRFLVKLAGEHQDYDAVRWLSYYARLGDRRVPGDDWESIEDKLTSDKRTLAAREWQDVQEHLSKTKVHVSKSVFYTVVKRIAKDAQWWRLGWFVVEEAKRAEDKTRYNILPRTYFHDGVPGQIKERKIKWLHFLESWGIKRSNAPENIKRGDEMQDKWLAIRYPATYDETGSVESLIDEVLVPMFCWWLDTEPEDCAKKKYPKKGALRSRIRTVLGVGLSSSQNEIPQGSDEAVQDGQPS